MKTRPENNIDGLFDNIINSYETRIQKIQTAFQSSEFITESSHSLFDHVHCSLDELRRERDLLNTKLCETIAKNGSLRKKDYQSMMSGMLNTLDEKELEAENQFALFIENQKETAQQLKNGLLDIKDITAQDVGEKIAHIKDQLSQITRLQEERKETVMKSFEEFQQLHNKMMEYLRNLVDKGDKILIEDIKKIRIHFLNEIQPSPEYSSKIK
jgi:F0F1-type ATP synthase membrane subunit b/b'